jgi:hypothetical protein
MGGFMTSFALKIAALLLMVADHIGFMFFPHAILLRIVGRLSFPIFAFLIAQGFKHTQDVRKYLFRLAVFAVVSEIPFDLFISRKLFDMSSQNVFFTLLLGLMALMLYDWFQKRRQVELAFLCVFTLCLIAQVMAADYGFAGVLLIFICYACRQRSVFIPWFMLAVCCTALTAFAASGPVWALVQLAELGALPFILSYNGKRGKSFKFLFYAFYPAHLLILYFLSIYLAV